MKFNLTYNMTVIYGDRIELRSGVHIIFAEDEVKALYKAKNFFNNESIVEYDGILKGINFIAFLEG